jgi:hypothetical protein
MSANDDDAEVVDDGIESDQDSRSEEAERWMEEGASDEGKGEEVERWNDTSLILSKKKEFWLR